MDNDKSKNIKTNYTIEILISSLVVFLLMVVIKYGMPPLIRTMVRQEVNKAIQEGRLNTVNQDNVESNAE